MALHKHYLVIFGGIFEITKEMDDCWVFNTKSRQFTQLFEDQAGRGSPIVSPGQSPVRRSMFMNQKEGASSPQRNSIRKDQIGLSGGLSPKRLSPMKKMRKRPRRIKKKDPLAELDVLSSPTSVNMKNSFIIKNADPSFDVYYHQMKKRKTPHGVDPHVAQDASYG